MNVVVRLVEVRLILVWEEEAVVMHVSPFVAEHGAADCGEKTNAIGGGGS